VIREIFEGCIVAAVLGITLAVLGVRDFWIVGIASVSAILIWSHYRFDRRKR